MSILGLHHITLVCANAQRTTDFYTRVLGLRLVKQTVNFDDPGSYHLYFGDATGRPGTAITYFEWPRAPKGHWGMGGTHHYALQVADYDGLLKWKRRLTDLQIPVEGPLDRHYFTSIYFKDPDGVIIEIATVGPGWTADEAPDSIGTEYREPPPQMVVNNRDEARIQVITWPEAVPEITADMALGQGMHHITAIGADIQQTHAFYGDLLGMRRLKMTSNFDDPNSAHWYWGAGEGKPGTVVTYFERNPHKTRPAQIGIGQTHHFALAVPDEAVQLEYRDKLLQAGFRVSPVMDRVYFKSIYTNDPDGHIVELATLGPGFLVDEDRDDLGKSLKLPPWLETYRPQIERALQPLTFPAWNPPESKS
ncbi:MAG: VOC family protein [Anaerolineae bacterium]|nr:VOC family protein [Anaerolineae bacterium]